MASLVTPVAELDDADELALAQAAPVSPAIPVEFVVDKAKTTAKKEQKEDEEPEADHLLEASPDTDEGPPLSHSSGYPLVHNSLDGITPLVMFSRFGESVKVTSGIDLNGFAPELTDSEESTSLSGFLIRPSSGDLPISITGVNEAPVAVDDVNSLNEDDPSVGPVTGVLNNDTDVDNVPADFSVTAIRTGGTEGSGTAGTVDGSTTLDGTYGSLVIDTEGTYTYTLFTAIENPTANATVQALNDGDTPLTDILITPYLMAS